MGGRCRADPIYFQRVKYRIQLTTIPNLLLHKSVHLVSAATACRIHPAQKERRRQFRPEGISAKSCKNISNILPILVFCELHIQLRATLLLDYQLGRPVQYLANVGLPDLSQLPLVPRAQTAVQLPQSHAGAGESVWLRSDCDAGLIQWRK